MELGSPNGGPPSWCGGRYSTPSCGGLKTEEECDASVVAAPPACASLACMEDLLALTGDLSNRCNHYNSDADACLKAYMTRMPGGVADGTYSPCEYSPDDPDRYKPDEDYDARCHSSQVRLECDFETVSPEADADTDAETDAEAETETEAATISPPPSTSPSPPPSPSPTPPPPSPAPSSPPPLPPSPPPDSCDLSGAVPDEIIG